MRRIHQVVYEVICHSQFTGDGDKYADAIAIAVDVITKRVSIHCMVCGCVSVCLSVFLFFTYMVVSSMHMCT